MQAKSSIVPMTLILAAMAASFAAGVNSTDGYSSRQHQAAGGSVVLETDAFDYFPSHYVNQATEIEELPAQF